MHEGVAPLPPPEMMKATPVVPIEAAPVTPVPDEVAPAMLVTEGDASALPSPTAADATDTTDPSATDPAPDTHPETGEKVDEVKKTEYVTQALKNLTATSRTAAGVIDTSASATKGDSMVQGLSSAEIADTAVANFAKAISDLYEMKDVSIDSPEAMKAFVEAVATQINGGLLKEGQLIRTGADSDKYPYTRIADLPAAMTEFYETFLQRLQDPNTDPKELAAWVEYRVDLTDHLFADGCGKSAKAISAWVLMRGDQPLPTYRGREELYAHAPKTIRSVDPAAAAQDEANWQEYYRTLF